MLRNIFQNLYLKLWLSFARDQVSTFQACIGQIEKGNISATEVAIDQGKLVEQFKVKKTKKICICGCQKAT